MMPQQTLYAHTKHRCTKMLLTAKADVTLMNWNTHKIEEARITLRCNAPSLFNLTLVDYNEAIRDTKRMIKEDMPVKAPGCTVTAINNLRFVDPNTNRIITW